MTKKNADKAYAKTKRGDWGDISPVTKVIPNKKAYNRNRDKKARDW